MKFAEPEMAPSAEKADAEMAMARIGDEMVAVENRLREAKDADEMAGVIEDMEEIRKKAAPVEATLRRVEALEKLGLEGADSTLRAQASELIARREKNADAVKKIKVELGKLNIDLETANTGLTNADSAEATLNALSKVDGLMAQIPLLEADLRQMEVEDSSIDSSLKEIQNKDLLKGFTIEGRAAA